MSDFSAFSLAGKRIMVTGANTGIGQGIALSIAKAGGAVIGVGRSAMDETAAMVTAAGASFTSVNCDLGDHAASSTMLRDQWTKGSIDGLVNNAGIIRRADAVAFTEKDWDDVMEVNLKTLFFLCQAFAEKLVEGRAAGPHRQHRLGSQVFQGGIRVARTRHRSTVLGITRLLACEWAARASTSTQSRQAMSSPITPRRCAAIPTAARRSSAASGRPLGRAV